MSKHILLTTLLLTSTLSLPALAHDDELMETELDCRCESGLSEAHHHGEDTDYSHAFKEGSPNLFTPHAVAPDTLYLGYSHNFFWTTLPRSSNPAFWFRYSPLERLQVDMLTTLRSPLEFEFGLAYQLLDEYRGDWFSLTPRLSFNTRGTVAGGELSATKFILPDIWQVGLDLRGLSSGAEDGFQRPVAAIGANTMVRVWKHWHLFADLSLPLDSEILQQRSVLWSAGLKKRIPHTPHVLTLYAGNTQEQSLTGRTISPGSNLQDFFRLGFVFTIEIPELTRMPERLF